MRNLLISRSSTGNRLWKSSLGPGWFALVALLLAISVSGCFSAIGHPWEPEPEPTPLPEPEPEPEPPVPEPCPIASEWVNVNVTYEEWGPQANLTIYNSECSSSDLYLANDCCYGVINRLEWVHEDGTVEAIGPTWDCVCGGPVDPMVIAPGDSVEIPDWGGWWYPESGFYRFVFLRSSYWECNDDPWTCNAEHPWQELVSTEFWVEL